MSHINRSEFLKFSVPKVYSIWKSYPSPSPKQKLNFVFLQIWQNIDAKHQ